MSSTCTGSSPAATRSAARSGSRPHVSGSSSYAPSSPPQPQASPQPPAASGGPAEAPPVGPPIWRRGRSSGVLLTGWAPYRGECGVGCLAGVGRGSRRLPGPAGAMVGGKSAVAVVWRVSARSASRVTRRWRRQAASSRSGWSSRQWQPRVSSRRCAAATSTRATQQEVGRLPGFHAGLGGLAVGGGGSALGGPVLVVLPARRRRGWCRSASQRPFGGGAGQALGAAQHAGARGHDPLDRVIRSSGARSGRVVRRRGGPGPAVRGAARPGPGVPRPCRRCPPRCAPRRPGLPGGSWRRAGWRRGRRCRRPRRRRRGRGRWCGRADRCGRRRRRSARRGRPGSAR